MRLAIDYHNIDNRQCLRRKLDLVGVAPTFKHTPSVKHTSLDIFSQVGLSLHGGFTDTALQGQNFNGLLPPQSAGALP